MVSSPDNFCLIIHKVVRMIEIKNNENISVLVGALIDVHICITDPTFANNIEFSLYQINNKIMCLHDSSDGSYFFDCCIMSLLNNSISSELHTTPSLTTLTIVSIPQTENVQSLLLQLVNEIKSLRSDVSELKKELHELKNTNERGLAKLTEKVTSVKIENRRSTLDSYIEDNLTDILKLPLNTIAEVIAFDEELQKNENRLWQFKQLISKVGGDGPAQFVRAAVRRVLSDEAASRYSWKGTKSKPSAERCYILTVLKNITHKKFKCTDKDINSVLQKHFVHANDRLAKRRRLN